MQDDISEQRIASIALPNGDPINVTMPPRMEGPSRFAFSLHKAGSSLLHSMLHGYCRGIGLGFLDLPTFTAENGCAIETMPQSSLASVLHEEGYCYWGWRTYPKSLFNLDTSKTRNILLVRDPRDRLVSQYFSFGRSHKVPAKGPARESVLAERDEISKLTIDQYALRMIDWIKMHWGRYHTYLSPETTRIYRYEDVIFRKEEWLADMVDYFGFSQNDVLIKEIAAQNDIRPDSEDPDKHIRQVKPGNYLKHLQGETIAMLDRDLNDYLKHYKYLEREESGERLVFAHEGREAANLLKANQV